MSMIPKPHFFSTFHFDHSVGNSGIGYSGSGVWKDLYNWNYEGKSLLNVGEFRVNILKIRKLTQTLICEPSVLMK